MDEFNEYLRNNQRTLFKVTKSVGVVRHREASKFSDIHEGQFFVGWVSLQEAKDGCVLWVTEPEGSYARTSLIKSVRKDSEDSWLVRTMNSVYHVKVLDE